MTEYLIPTGRAETELVEKRSRFIGQVWPVESEEEARARIEETKKKHYDARHNCWCYRIQEGGVSGTPTTGSPRAPRASPCSNVFQREGVTNVCCVVTRYFGGVLLGAGGLVLAYTQERQGRPGRGGHLGGAPLGGGHRALPLLLLRARQAGGGGRGGPCWGRPSTPPT